MGSDKFLYIVFLLVALLVANTYMNYRTYSLSRKAEGDRRIIETLKGQLNRMNIQLSDLDNRLGQLPERISQVLPSLPSLPPDFGPKHSPPKPLNNGKGGDIDHFSQSSDFGDPGAIPVPPPRPPIPSEKLVAYRKSLIDRNLALHQADEERYGSQLSEIYNRALNQSPSGSASGENDDAFSQLIEDSDAAFLRLIEEYPESNATSIAIAERALESALKANTVDAESYYEMLTENENFSSLVTDYGIEVVSAIQGYLADQYIQQGRITEAESIISLLENSKGQGFVAVPGSRGEPEWRSVSEVIHELRQRLQSSQ